MLFSVLLFTAPVKNTTCSERPGRASEILVVSRLLPLRLTWVHPSKTIAMNRPSGCNFDGLFRKGIRLFNAARFFEAHEALEDVWRVAPAPERNFLQGLIQIAVALHHHSKGNIVGCRSLLQRGLGNLAPYPERYFGLELGCFRNDVELWRKALESAQPLSAPPAIRLQA